MQSQTKEMYNVSRDITFKLKGILDKSLRGRQVILKGLNEDDILEIKHMITENMKHEARSKAL